MSTFNVAINSLCALIVVFCQSTFALDDSAATRPNIILINLDDADYRMFEGEHLELYPSIKRLCTEGISFTNLHVTTPFCGPSRAALFRGQYAHRTGVRVNIPESPLSLGFRGGYSEFLRQGHHEDELGVWMKSAGYRTMLIGKYHHNGFDFKIPPGWDDFYTSLGGRYQGTYRFTNQTKKLGESTRNGLDVYRTDQEASDAVRLIREHTSSRSSQPFFLYLAPLAPHRPVGRDITKMVDEQKYSEWNSHLKIPRTPDFDESQISDKPLHRQSPPYSKDEIDYLNLEYVCRARAVKSVDDLVERVLNALQATNQFDKTYVLFTSDNGCLLGQHRLHNKLDPYELSSRAPMFVIGPGVRPGFANHLLAHIDITATVLDLAEADLPSFLDGKSFLPLIKNREKFNESEWRKYVIIENWAAKQNRHKNLPGAYSGLRFYDRKYIEWVDGAKEFYDLRADPFELENEYEQLSDLEKQDLKTQLISSRSVTMDPLVTVLPKPVENWKPSEPRTLLGYAEDDGSVQKVTLTIQSKQSGKFWDGRDWSDEPSAVFANLAREDQQLTQWDYTVNGWDGKQTLSIIANATDSEGHVSKPFSVDVGTEEAGDQR